jgi:organic radical activating enzyme
MNVDCGMPFLSSIGFSITARCPVACPHCIVEAGPRRTEEMALADACDWMEQAAAYRDGYIKSIIFTGGEPFFNRTQLEEFLACAVSCGLVPAVVTNAFWASSLREARATLRSLPQIRMLTVSTDLYHERSIPFEYVINAITAAGELGVMCNAAVCFLDEDEPSYREFRERLNAVLDERLIRTSAIFPAGRALQTIDPGRFVRTGEPPAAPCTGADFPTVFPDGRVVGCMGILTDLPAGHPLLLGHLGEKPLDQILDAAEMNTALHILRVWGPGRLIRMLREAGLGRGLPRDYLKHGYCDLCYALLSDEGLMAGLLKVTGDPETVEKVAYARYYFLRETAMIERLEGGELEDGRGAG